MPGYLLLALFMICPLKLAIYLTFNRHLIFHPFLVLFLFTSAKVQHSFQQSKEEKFKFELTVAIKKFQIFSSCGHDLNIEKFGNISDFEIFQ